MAPSKKRKLESDTEVASKDETEIAASEALEMSNEADTAPATSEAASEDKPNADDSAVDKNAERQARFKALQARAVNPRIPFRSSDFVLTSHAEKFRPAQPQRSSRRSSETIY